MSGDNPQNEFPPGAGQVPPPKDTGPAPPPQDGPNPYGDPSAVPPPKPATETDKDARNMGMLAHLLGGLLAIFLGPLSFAAPLIIWLVKKDDSPFVADQGREALNFQITMVIGYVIMFVLAVVSCGFLSFLALIPWILQIVFGIIGAVAASKGEYYRYPLTIRMIQ